MNAIKRQIEKDFPDEQPNGREGAEPRSGKPQVEVAFAGMERYLTVADVANLLGVCERTVYDALRNGRLPGRKFGRVWRVKTQSIDAWGVGNRTEGRWRDAF